MSTNMNVLGTLAIVGALSLTGLAHADVVQAESSSDPSTRTVLFSADSGDGYSNTTLHSFNWMQTGGDRTSPGETGLYKTYYIELSEFVSTSHTYDSDLHELSESSQPGGGVGAVHVTRQSELWGWFHDDDAGKKHDDDADKKRDGDSHNLDYALAFQLTVLEVAHDDDLSLSALNLQFDVNEHDRSMDMAQDWINTLDEALPFSDMTEVSSTQQDHVLEVPNPASAAMFTLACIFGAVTRRRRNRILT